MGVFPPILIASLALFLNNPLFLTRYDPTPAPQLRKYTFIASLPTLFIASLPRLMPISVRNYWPKLLGSEIKLILHRRKITPIYALHHS